MVHITKRERQTQVIPATTTIVMPMQELLQRLRISGIDLPEGGMYELKFDPNTEKLTIIHTE